MSRHPYRADATELARPRPATHSRPNRTPARTAVLLVDDVADNLLALSALLRRDDFQIVTASCGREALEALLEHDIAVAIVDVMMPEVDGFELAELIRGVERTRHIPIIFVTAATKAEYRAFAGYQLGAIDFLFKPIDEHVLRAKVGVLVELERQRRELQASLRTAERARSETKVLLDLAQATSHSGSPDELYEPALAAVGELFGAERSAILLRDADGTMRFRAWRNVSPTYRTAVDGHSPWPADATDARPILIEDVATAPAMAPFLAVFAAEGIRALAFVPIQYRDRELLGKFMLYWSEPRTFSEHESDLAVAVAAQIGQALSHARLRATERSAQTQLERTLHDQEVFAGVLAHDLRNPLNAMLTAAHAARLRAGSDPDVASAASLIVSSGNRMRILIDQLLDFTRARVGGGIGIQPRPTDLARVAAQAVAELTVVHRSWSIALAPRGDVTGTWDPDRLFQVLSNLLTNACLHGTPPGSVRIDLDGTAPDHVEIAVHNGGHIPEALLPALFEPFRTTCDERPQGLGLGLFIAKHIVDGHGGAIGVVSTQAAGTTFRIRLPRDSRLPPAGSDGPIGAP